MDSNHNLSKKSFINPETVFNSRQFGFSQAIKVESNKMLFISGQVAWDQDRNLIGEGDLSRQTEQALRNLNSVLHAAGGRLSDICMLRIYKVNYAAEDSRIIGQHLLNVFGDSPPAMSLLGVQALANPRFLIEIEAQAVISG